MLKIGLRIPGACGGELTPTEFAEWCKAEGFDAVDLNGPDKAFAGAVRAAGLAVGTVDLAGTQKLLSPDTATRQEGVEEGIARLQAIKDLGGDKAFCVFFPADARQSKRNSFDYWKSSFPDVAREAARLGVRIAVEGWPGPNNSALGVTPETLRAMFETVPTDAFGINYDPSHLIRVGVDYRRFLNEFAPRVIHAHGKDTAPDAEGAYLYGDISPTWAKSVAFGDGAWRYTIPGEGVADWSLICPRLAQAGFDGVIAIELEDFRYNGTVDGEKRGLSRARSYLSRLL